MSGGRKTPADPDEVEDELEQLEEEGAIVTHHKGADMAKEPTDKAEPKAEPKHEIPEDAELPRAGSINEPPGSNVLDRGPPPKPEVEPPASRRLEDEDDENDDKGKNKRRK